MNETGIIERILNGNTNDYRLLVEQHQQSVFRICMGYVHNEDDANDLTQDTFINAYQNLPKFNFDAAFSTWLFRIAINLCLNHLRSKKRNIFERFEDVVESFSNKRTLAVSDFSNPEEVLINEEHRGIVQKEIDKLSDKQKSAFILSKYKNLSQKEIAAIMNISEGAVESLVQRAKANLSKKLSGYFQKK